MAPCLPRDLSSSLLCLSGIGSIPYSPCPSFQPQLFPSPRLDKAERSHLGVGQLRRFLEQLLQKRYLDSVPAIVPLLERETRNVQVGSGSGEESCEEESVHTPVPITDM